MTTNERIAKFNSICPIEGLTDIMKQEKWSGFFTAPASTKYHGAYAGGLFDHSFAVYVALSEFTELNNIKWQRPESPFIIGMFHDLCKFDGFKITGNFIEHNDDTLFKGHGKKSVMLLSTILKLTEEEAACICYHMGSFTDRDQWNDYTAAIAEYPNVLWTHHADMYAAHVLGT